MAGLVRMMNVTLRTVKHGGNLLGGNNGPPKKKKSLYSQIPCQAVNQAMH